jgi:hypothetical protein
MTNLSPCRRAAEFTVERGLDLDSLFSERWGLEQGDEAYRSFDRQTGGKGVFLM